MENKKTKLTVSGKPKKSYKDFETSNTQGKMALLSSFLLTYFVILICVGVLCYYIFMGIGHPFLPKIKNEFMPRIFCQESVG